MVRYRPATPFGGAQNDGGDCFINKTNFLPLIAISPVLDEMAGRLPLCRLTMTPVEMTPQPMLPPDFINFDVLSLVENQTGRETLSNKSIYNQAIYVVNSEKGVVA